MWTRTGAGSLRPLTFPAGTAALGRLGKASPGPAPARVGAARASGGPGGARPRLAGAPPSGLDLLAAVGVLATPFLLWAAFLLAL